MVEEQQFSFSSVYAFSTVKSIVVALKDFFVCGLVSVARKCDYLAKQITLVGTARDKSITLQLEDFSYFCLLIELQ